MSRVGVTNWLVVPGQIMYIADILFGPLSVNYYYFVNFQNLLVTACISQFPQSPLLHSLRCLPGPCSQTSIYFSFQKERIRVPRVEIICSNYTQG